MPASTPESAVQQIASLSTGDSYGKTKRFDMDDIPKAEVNTWLESTAKVIDAAVSRAKKICTDCVFKTERGDFRTRSGDVIAAVVVTRMS